MSSQNHTAPDAEGSGAPQSWFAQKFPTFARLRHAPKTVGRVAKPIPNRLLRGLSFLWRGLRFIFKWRPRLFRRALALVIVAYIGFSIYASVLLNRELAEIRAQGEPLNFAELAPPPVPDAQNAALVYRRAFKSLVDMKGGTFPSLTDFDSPQTAQALIAVLQKNQKGIALTRQAASIPQCRFLVNWKTSPVQIIWSHFAQQRQLARLMAAQAVWEAQSGDSDAALRDVRCIYVIASQLNHEPTLIGFLVARAIHELGDRALFRVLSIKPIPAQKGRAFIQSLPNTDWSAAFRLTYLGERTFSVWVFANVSVSPLSMEPVVEYAEEDWHPPKVLTVPSAWLWKPFAKMDEIYDLRLWKRMVASITPMQVPMPEGTIGNFDRDVENAPRYALLTRTLFPVFTRTRQSRDKFEVQIRQREAALALSAYQARHGQYPNTLAEAEREWGASLPPDIYSDKPFVYRKQGSDFALYSVGPNREDDGASTIHDVRNLGRGNSYTDDLVWGAKS